MSTACPAACDSMHPGYHRRPLNCPDCGRLSAASWSWETYDLDGYYQTWGGICSLHGRWSHST